MTKVSQVGTDRIIEIQFSDGQYRLFFEFYAGGNVVLTDQDLKILALLRIVSEGQEQEELRIGLQYSIENRQNYGGIPELSVERVKNGLEKVLERAKADEAAGKKHKKKNKPEDALRRALAVSTPELPPILLEHALLAKQFPTSTSVEALLKDEDLMRSLVEALLYARSIVGEITTAETSKGYIVAKTTKPKPPIDQPTEEQDVDKENQNLLYDDFHPFRPLQFEKIPDTQMLEIEGFNKAVDEFFSSIESQKLESRLTEREEHAKKKIEAARQDHERRLGGLQQVQELNVRKAQAIEGNLQRVHEATAAVNSLIAQGMDWVEISRLIEMEKARQNPVADLIKLPLKLHENTINLLLAEGEAELEDDDLDDETESEYSDSEDESKTLSKPKESEKMTAHVLDVDIDLALSGWSNARQYYDQKKSAAVKEQKTLQASETALKNTERRINADLKKGLKQEKAVLRPVRKQFWFEKFFYFVSSESYLVLGGKDPSQNELLYKRYLSKGDAYIHADLEGASSVIVKNKPGFADSPIPPSTIGQAGTFSVATSKAWDSKAVMSAWWVHADQVTKTAHTGDILGIGNFLIKGQKNYLPPAQLLMGLGVMFQINDESKARHLKHRIPQEQPASQGLYGTGRSINFEEAKNDGGDNREDLSEPESEADQEPPEHLNGLEPDNHLDENQESLKPEEQGYSKLTSGDEAEESDEEPDQNMEDCYQNPLQAHASAATRNGLDESQNEVLQSEEKERSHGSDNNEDSDEKEESITTDAQQLSAIDSAADDRSSVTSDQKKAPQVRGKHGKRAKMKNKYAHQDEEDRALALRLLGSIAGQEKAKADKEKKEAREAEQAAQKERRQEQHKRAQESGKESEEARRLRMEEGAETLDEEEVAELSLVDSFIGSPLPGDEILDCLVVCAPWDAMGSRCKWRVKLQPGSQKKGKAVKEVLEHWGRGIAEREKRRMPDEGDERYQEEKVARREGELVKGLRDVEVVGVVPVGKVRTMIAGGGGGDKGKGGKGGGKGGGGRGGWGSKKAR